jgi:ABC-2 type transport system permease protein
VPTVFRKALWDQRKVLPAWASAIALLILLESSMWPSMRDMPSFDEYLAEIPTALKDVFGIDTMTTGIGFLNAELFSLVLPLMFLVFGILRGARMIAGEEEAGTLDLLLVTPLSTTRLLLEQALALAASLALLGVAAVASTLLGTLLFDLGIGLEAMLAGAAACALLGFEFGTLALVAGALTGRRGAALGVATAAALAAYVLHLGGLLVDGLHEWRVLSPFHQALHTGPLADTLPASFLALVVVPVVVYAVVLPFWARRDIGTA